MATNRQLQRAIAAVRADARARKRGSTPAQDAAAKIRKREKALEKIRQRVRNSSAPRS